MTLRQAANALPFLWSEIVGRNYFADFALPVDYVVEGLQYLGNMTSGMKDRVSIYPIDQTEAARFPIPYKLFDPSAIGWTLNSADLTQKFEHLLVQIKSGVS